MSAGLAVPGVVCRPIYAPTPLHLAPAGTPEQARRLQVNTHTDSLRYTHTYICLLLACLLICTESSLISYFFAYKSLPVIDFLLEGSTHTHTQTHTHTHTHTLSHTHTLIHIAFSLRSFLSLCLSHTHTHQLTHTFNIHTHTHTS